MKAILLISIIIFVKILINGFRFLKTKNLYRKFKTRNGITSYIPEIDSLFKNANTSYRTTYDERKHGYLERTVRDVAYLADRKDYFLEVDKVFQLTLGVYRIRLKNSINPFYWIFLPIRILQTHSINPNVFIKTLITLCYWTLGSLASYHLNVLLDFLYLEYLQQVFEKIL